MSRRCIRKQEDKILQLQLAMLGLLNPISWNASSGSLQPCFSRFIFLLHIPYSCFYALKLLKVTYFSGQKASPRFSIFPFMFLFVCLFVFCATAPQWARAFSFSRFLDLTQRRATVGRTPLDEWSLRRRDLYLTTHNTHNRNIHAPGGIRTQISADERPRPTP